MKTCSITLALICIFLNFHSSYSQETNTNIETKKEYTNVEEALKNPEKVYRLNLGNQKISLTDNDWSKFINLEYLSLQNDHLIEIPLAITNLKTLKILDISGNDFKTLPIEFEKLVNLEELYLNNEKNINLPKTLAVLAQLPNLKTLHLENDNLSKLPEEILAFKNLENLYLNHNKFKQIPQVKTLDHLKYLDLNDNKIEPKLQDMKNLNFGFKINF